MTAGLPLLFLVEDDDQVRRTMHLVLQGRGYAVRSYSAATPALADPTLTKATLLVADYRLPDGDGLMIRSAMKGKGWRGASILITGYGEQALNRAALESGYDVILQKPVAPFTLAGVIDRLVPAENPRPDQTVSSN